ncbi:MAG: murein transglycosylase A [Bacteroidota bacterium]
MNGSKAVLWLCLWLIPLQCTPDQTESFSPTAKMTLEDLDTFPIATAKPPKVQRSGKLKNAAKLKQTYTKTNLSNFALPYIGEALADALDSQQLLLKRRKQRFQQNFDNISLNLSDLETTIKLLATWQKTQPEDLEAHLNAYQLKGKDGRGNVKFTGYFTPEIKVSKQQSEVYPYPIYAYPKNWDGALPTRQQIDGEKVLQGKGLELAYAQRLEDIYYMQLQGSGLVRFPNGTQQYFGYAGTNQHKYQSIGKHIKNSENIPLKNISMKGIKNYLKHHPQMVEEVLFANPSYVFFAPTSKAPLGAGHVPLTADYSIAVDTRHLPLGSCLLAAVPVIDQEGYFSHHEYKFLLAQDVGGAIRGNGHVDVYCGVGEEGQRKASALHHYGQLWLLLPKSLDEQGFLLSERKWVRDNL